MQFDLPIHFSANFLDASHHPPLFQRSAVTDGLPLFLRRLHSVLGIDGHLRNHYYRKQAGLRLPLFRLSCLFVFCSPFKSCQLFTDVAGSDVADEALLHPFVAALAFDKLHPAPFLLGAGLVRF